MNEAENRNNIRHCLLKFLDVINKHRNPISDLTHNFNPYLQHHHFHTFHTLDVPLVGIV